MTALNRWADLLDDRERNRQHQIKDAGHALLTDSTADAVRLALRALLALEG
jgi:hypothetical protein